MSTSQLRHFLLVLFGTLIFGGCASDGSTQQDEQMANLEVNEAGEYVFPEDEADELVCRRVRPTGSHFPKRVCKTRRELAEEERKVMESYGPLGVEAGTELRY